MKKTLFTLLVVSASMMLAQAQLIDKGAIMVGGDLEFTSHSKNSTFELRPMLGYFFADNAALGTGFSYSSVSNFRRFSLSPFARYYLNFGLFGHAGVQFTHIKDAEKPNDFDIVAGLGYALFLNNNVAFEPLLTVNFLDGEPYTRLGISFQVYFNR